MKSSLGSFWLPGLIALLAATPILAQYKVVGPDGRVTYTDRAPSSADSRITSLGARGSAPVDVALPVELRQAVSRYPVTLYVLSGICEPCDSARQLLRGRGIPHAEKQIVSTEDGDTFERLTGGRDAPTLTIGSQTLRGLAPEVWSSYLDAAGYPRESRLPSTYQYAAPTPLTERREANAKATASAVKPPQADAPAAPAANVGGIKF